MKGYTLIELMVAVALIGVFASIAGGAFLSQRAEANAELQRERARQALEYWADCVTRGEPVDDAVVQRLVEALPQARLEKARRGGVSVLSVRWRGPSRPERFELALFEGGGG